MRYPEVRRQNRNMLLLLMIGLALTLILMSLPIYSFDVGVYSKKSGNTFVGDEKYQQVRAEVESAAEEYRSQGFDVEIQESVIERVNSKGETTSLITFTISERYSRNLFSFLGKGFPSSRVLAVMLVLLAAAVVFTAVGMADSMDVLQRYLSPRAKTWRNLAIVSLLLALVLVPVFILMNNVSFSRQLSFLTVNATCGRRKSGADR